MLIPTGRIWQCHVCSKINSYDENEIYCTGCGKKCQPKIDTLNDDIFRVTREASKKTMDSNLLPPL